MTIDRRIHAELDRRAGAVDTPWPPPLEDLLEAGRAEVRRRRARHRLVGVGVLAAALVLAVPSALVLAGSSGDPERTPAHTPVARADRLLLRQLPVGAPPSSLYCLDGVAHWRQDALRMSNGTCAWPHRYAEAGGSAVVADGGRQMVTLFTTSGRQEVPARLDIEASPVVFSLDGGTVAWVSRVRFDGREEVVLWDTRRGVEVKRVLAPTSDELNLEGIDGAERVYLTSVGSVGGHTDRIWVWASRGDEGFVRVTGLGDFVTVADVPPAGFAVLKTGNPVDGGDAVWGVVTDRGEFFAEWSTEARPVVWSPDRSRMVVVSSNVVVKPSSLGDSGRSVRLGLPADVSVVSDPSWESEKQVLVPVEPASGDGVSILRCSASNGHCEVAAVGTSSDFALPGDDVDNMG